MYSKKVYEFLRSHNVCIDCGEHAELARCAKCLERTKSYAREYRAKKSERGECVLCKGRVVPGRRMCETHLKITAENRRRERSEKS